MGEFRKRYRDLEMSIHSVIREQIENSKFKSKFISENVLPIEFNDFKEIAIINDSLTLIDYRGLHYDIFVITLEDLIDILEN